MAMTAQSEYKAQTLIEFTSIHNPLKCKAIQVNYVDHSLPYGHEKGGSLKLNTKQTHFLLF